MLISVLFGLERKSIPSIWAISSTLNVSPIFKELISTSILLGILSGRHWILTSSERGTRLIKEYGYKAIYDKKVDLERIFDLGLF